jgi:large subunit ribosomal protein L9
MKIVLHDRIDGLGGRGDVVEVADGYARNFLIPGGKAHMAAAGAEAQAATMKRTWQVQNTKDRAGAEEMAQALVARSLSITARASAEGKLFGSVSSADVAAAIAEQAGIEIDRKLIELDDGIKEVGSHMVTVHPHPDVQFPVTIEVIGA